MSGELFPNQNVELLTPRLDGNSTTYQEQINQINDFNIKMGKIIEEQKEKEKMEQADDEQSKVQVII